MGDDTSPPNGSGLTMKELLLSIGADVKAVNAKLDAFIQAHQIQHSAEQQQAMGMAADPQATVAGRAIIAQVNDIVNEKSRDHAHLADRITSVEGFVSAERERRAAEMAVESARRRDAAFRLALMGLFASTFGSTFGVLVSWVLAHH